MPRPGPDRPVTKIDDKLDFKDYVQPITRTIKEAAKADRLPLTIGIFGRWGSGKTSLMRMVEEELGLTPEERAQADRRSSEALRALWWGWPIAIVWGLLLIGGILLAVIGAGWIQNLLRIPYSMAQVAWLAAFFGASGGLMRVIFELWLHGYVEKDLDPQYVLGYALRPLWGLILGILIYLVVSVIYVGLFRSEVTTLSILIYVLAAYLGSFQDQVLALLFRITERLSSRDARNPDAASATQSTQAVDNLDSKQDYQVIWFNAWKFAKEDELWAALLQEVLRQIKVQARGGDRLRVKWQLWRRSIDWKSGTRDVLVKLLPTAGKSILAAGAAFLGGWLADIAVTSRFGAELGQAAGTAGSLLVGLVGVSGWLRTNVVEPMAEIDFNKYRKKASYKDHLTFLAEFSDEFKVVTRIARGAGNPIVLMLDDLDRCLPEQAVSVLEAIKLFISDDAPVVFLIGADREFVERSIEVKYEKFPLKDDPNPQRAERFAQLGREYLEKIVQLSFNLPPIRDTEIDKFIDEVFAENTRVRDNSHIFAAGLHPNPRQVIRAINVFNFVIELAQQKGLLYADRIQPNILAKVAVVQYRWPDLFADLVEDPELLGQIEASYSTQPPQLEVETQALVDKHIAKRGLQQLLTVENTPTLVGVDLGEYIFLTARAVTQADQAQASAEESKKEPSKPSRRKRRTPGDVTPGEAAIEADVKQLRSWVTGLKDAGADPTQVTELEENLKQAGTLIKDGKTTEARRIMQLVADKIDKNNALVEYRGWQAKIEALSQTAADSALLAQMRRKLESADQLIRANDIWGAGGEFERMKELYKKAQKDLDARASSSERLIQAEVSKDGRLLFQRAVTYETVEIILDIPGKEKPGQFRAYSATGERVSDTPPLRARVWDVASGIKSGKYKQADLNWLRDELSKCLSPIAPISSQKVNLKLRLTTNSQEIDELPWELAYLDPDDPKPLGLSTHYAFVRGVANPSPTQLDLSILNPRILVLHPADQSEESLDTIKNIRFPIPVQFFTYTDLQDSYSLFQKERPAITHLIVTEPVTGWGARRDSRGHSLRFNNVEVEFDRRDLGLLVLDINDSRRIANGLVGDGLSAVVGWQSGFDKKAAEAFYFPFYNALLRSSQPEFAITEGRRAIAAVLGYDSPLAISPVLYMGSSEVAAP